jgi:bifunctional ADP-heptose synthase (sugar kinase/adenylyltransferase)
VVLVFDDLSPLGVIEALRPEVYVKGGDYTLDSLNPVERSLLESVGAEICLLPLVEDFSTSGIIKKLQQRG